MSKQIGDWKILHEDGDMVIGCDDKSFIVADARVSNGAKTLGRTVLRNESYFTSIGQAVAKFVDRTARRKCDGLADYAARVEAACKRVEGLLDGAAARSLADAA